MPPTPLDEAHHGGSLFTVSMTEIYTKPPLSIDEQIAHLRRCGLVIPDEVLARHYLKYVSYYRLSAYWLPFKQKQISSNQQDFKQGTTFRDVVSLYVFDRELRLLVADAIERIEIAIRGIWAYHMAMVYGSHGYLSFNIYKNRKHFDASLILLKKELENSTETFIRHYLKKYKTPSESPIWVVSEILSFGQLSKWISNLRRPRDRWLIAREFHLDEDVFISAMRQLAHIRNICAHHGRLWNKRLTTEMKRPKHPVSLGVSVNEKTPKNIYNSLCMMQHLLQVTSPSNKWGLRLEDLLTRANIDVGLMGFPYNWKALPLWKG